VLAQKSADPTVPITVDFVTPVRARDLFVAYVGYIEFVGVEWVVRVVRVVRVVSGACCRVVGGV